MMDRVHAARPHGDPPLDARIEREGWYSENLSIWIDFQILFRTLLEVLRGRNAY